MSQTATKAKLRALGLTALRRFFLVAILLPCANIAYAINHRLPWPLLVLHGVCLAVLFGSVLITDR